MGSAIASEGKSAHSKEGGPSGQMKKSRKKLSISGKEFVREKSLEERGEKMGVYTWSSTAILS